MAGTSDKVDRYRTDCRKCHALCCTVLAHIPDNGFPSEKPANQACRHLAQDRRCGIFEGLEAAGYSVCRAYDCHGAGPLVSRWIDADDAPAPNPGRLEDFRQLARMHLLTMAIRRASDAEDPDAMALFDALDTVSVAYRRDGVFTMTGAARAALRRNQALVTAVLARLKSR